MAIIMKIFGYYTLSYILVRIYHAIKRKLKSEKDVVQEMIAGAIMYIPMVIFILYELYQSGMRL